ncbi:hypothetical protein O3P69_017046 [Scylla paramamosain]|uniref:Uncharacterized protein n=1 Tax=Scylla paramamosain TaxID=85552 RepID=A0AAW0TTK7_SCYPA
MRRDVQDARLYSSRVLASTTATGSGRDWKQRQCSLVALPSPSHYRITACTERVSGRLVDNVSALDRTPPLADTGNVTGQGEKKAVL